MIKTQTVDFLNIPLSDSPDFLLCEHLCGSSTDLSCWKPSCRCCSGSGLPVGLDAQPLSTHCESRDISHEGGTPPGSSISDSKPGTGTCTCACLCLSVCGISTCEPTCPYYPYTCGYTRHKHYQWWRGEFYGSVGSGLLCSQTCGSSTDIWPHPRQHPVAHWWWLPWFWELCQCRKLGVYLYSDCTGLCEFQRLIDTTGISVSLQAVHSTKKKKEKKKRMILSANV